MRREFHVRFREGGGVKFPSATRLVMGFEHREDAEQFRKELGARFAPFGLELHADKTRLIEFGRTAVRNRKQRGDGKPETFDFLGLTHICGNTRRGHFTVQRLTMRKRMQRKLKELKQELRRRLHASIPEQGAYLRSVVRGHCQYYGVPGNSARISLFRLSVGRLWLRTLRRRSQKHRLPWSRMERLVARWLPAARVCHPYPRPSWRHHLTQEPDAVVPHVRICGRGQGQP